MTLCKVPGPGIRTDSRVSRHSDAAIRCKKFRQYVALDTESGVPQFKVTNKNYSWRSVQEKATTESMESASPSSLREMTSRGDL
jgi:hypothetical protein